MERKIIINEVSSFQRNPRGARRRLSYYRGMPSSRSCCCHCGCDCVPGTCPHRFCQGPSFQATDDLDQRSEFSRDFCVPECSIESALCRSVWGGVPVLRSVLHGSQLVAGHPISPDPQGHPGDAGQEASCSL